MTRDQYLETEGKGEEEFAEEVREGARTAVKAQLVLDAVADAEELGVTDAELTDQVVRRAQRAGVSPDQYAQSGGPVRPAAGPGAGGPPRQGAGHRHGGRHDPGRRRQRRRPRGAARRPRAGAAPSTSQFDEDGRPFHTHADGAVHYLDEE